jgi:indolepyruvate ferredoxin oxidoreductase
VPETLDEMIERRVEFLTGYQNRAYAEDYRRFVDKVRASEAERVKGATALTQAVARYLFKLMAYKDEYEVARLYTDGRFAEALAKAFKGEAKLTFHLAPPLLAERDPVTGHLRKRAFGPWMMSAFKLLARLKACAAHRSIRSAAARNAGASASLSSTTATPSRRSSPRSPPPITPLPWKSPRP